MPFNVDSGNPLDNATIPDYPANERASRTALEGLIDVEHDATSGTKDGRHKFAVGDDTAKAAITTWVNGSIFFNTDDSGLVTTRYYPQIRAGGSWLRLPNAFLDLQQSWTAAQGAEYSALSYAAAIAPDLALSNFFSVTATGNISFLNPTNKPSAGSYVIEVTQDGTGTRLITWDGADYAFSFNSEPVATNWVPINR